MQTKSARAGSTTLELNEEAKQIVRDFCAAVNSAVERSSEVADTIGRLRDAGYDLELNLKLEIGLRAHETEILNGEETEPADLQLTDDDRRILQRMKIRLDDPD